MLLRHSQRNSNLALIRMMRPPKLKETCTYLGVFVIIPFSIVQNLLIAPSGGGVCCYDVFIADKKHVIFEFVLKGQQAGFVRL